VNETNKKHVKSQYEKSFHPTIFSKGDLVLVYDQEKYMLGTGKFNPMWHGTYIMRHALQKEAYEISDFEGNFPSEPKNGLYLKRYYA